MTATDQTVPFIHAPGVDQELPSHLARYLAEAPSAFVKLPPA